METIAKGENGICVSTSYKQHSTVKLARSMILRTVVVYVFVYGNFSIGKIVLVCEHFSQLTVMEQIKFVKQGSIVCVSVYVQMSKQEYNKFPSFIACFTFTEGIIKSKDLTSIKCIVQ